MHQECFDMSLNQRCNFAENSQFNAAVLFERKLQEEETGNISIRVFFFFVDFTECYRCATRPHLVSTMLARIKAAFAGWTVRYVT